MSLKCNVLKSGFCEVTQGFVNGHRGLDLVDKDYTIGDIVSFANGTVQMVTNGYGNGQGEGVNWAYGNFVKILNDDGTVCLYAHMEYTSVLVGQKVSKGELLGRMGNSGNSSNGHLHWEFWCDNVYEHNIDPSPYLEPKPTFVQPSTVDRDKTKRQFQVDYNDNLRVRATPGGNILGILNKGIYNFTEEINNGILWIKIGESMWCACTEISRILEIEKPQDKPILDIEKEQGYIDTINELNGRVVSLNEEKTALSETIEINKRCYEENNKNKEETIDILKKKNKELEDKLALNKKDDDNYNLFISKKDDNYFINLKENENLKYKIN